MSGVSRSDDAGALDRQDDRVPPEGPQPVGALLKA